MGQPTTESMLRPYRVVVADDAADLRYLLTRALEATGRFAVVGTAGTGHEAVTQATQHRPDLTLLDLQMPEMDGLKALPRIRSAVPECAVVVLSGLDAERMAATARMHGAAGYLEKGLSPTGVVAELLGLLESLGLHAPVGPDAATEHEVDHATIDLPAELVSGRQARHFVTDKLAAWSLESLVDTAALLTSELVTNAVVHARSAVALTVRNIGDRVRVEVADSGGGALTLREPTLDDTHGRGLLLMETLAAAWGTSADDAGKLVWFELPAAP